MNWNTQIKALMLVISASSICFPFLSKAESIPLEWDPPVTCTDGTPLSNLQGYRVYHGLASGVYSDHLDVTNGSSLVTYPNLQAGNTHFFAVTALTSDGNESAYSDELTLYIPPSIVLNTHELSIQEGSSSFFQVRLSGPPSEVTTVTVSRVDGGSCHVGVVSGTALVFSPSNWNSDQSVIVAALYDSVKTNRVADFQCEGMGVYPAVISVTAEGQGSIPTVLSDSVDSDGNNLPDSWEILQFGGLGVMGASPDGDYDRDGVSNYQEFIGGTDPADFRSLPLLNIGHAGASTAVSFQARQATGSGYQGKSRYYTLERCSNLRQGTWEEVPAATMILAQNQVFSYVEDASGTGANFYRTRISLQ